MPADFQEIIEQKAEKPAAMAGDQGSVTQRPLTELIEADKHQAANAAIGKKRRGIVFTQLKPRGTV